MAKRKAVTQARPAAREPVNGSSKLTVNHYNDIADSEDEYLLERDEILLDEGPEAKRRRRLAEDEALLEASDEEVLDYSDEDEDEDEEDDNSDEEIPAPASKKRGQKAGSDDEEEADVGDEEPQDEYGDWEGDYYGADEVETEEAALAEEKEARRLQQKQLQRISAADFGFDEQEWAAKGDEAEDGETGNVVELLPQLEVSEDLTPEERLKLLRNRYPEFEPIRREFADLQEEREVIAKEAERAQELLALRKAAFVDAEATASHPAILRHQALSAYLGVMVMYFAVLSSTATREAKSTAMAPLQLREHPVMESLLKTRSLWNKVRDLKVPSVDEEIAALKNRSIAAAAMSAIPALNGSAAANAKDTAMIAATKKATKPSRAEREAALLQQQSSARRAQRLAELETDFADLSNKPRTPAIRKPKTKQPTNGTQSDADLGDAATLLPHELAEKAARRKTLQFYTSQIAQKANKRGAAGRDAGGDIDLPHRERWKDKQARLNAEAERRAELHGHQNGDAQAQTSSARKQVQSTADDDDEEEDYYQTIVNKQSAKKAAKTAAAQAYSEAQKVGGRVVEQETIGADGKRAITYAIEKNKGLTPHRKKENRNPRVKKRMKFEEKKKKLGSVRAVYKGGEGRGGYGGELSGIKSGLVKSVRL